jgi:hypothetical protein
MIILNQENTNEPTLVYAALNKLDKDTPVQAVYIVTKTGNLYNEEGLRNLSETLKKDNLFFIMGEQINDPKKLYDLAKDDTEPIFVLSTHKFVSHAKMDKDMLEHLNSDFVKTSGITSWEFLLCTMTRNDNQIKELFDLNFGEYNTIAKTLNAYIDKQ